MSRANPRFRRNNQKLPTPVLNVYRLKLVGEIESQETVSTFWYNDDTMSGTSVNADLSEIIVGCQAVGGLLDKYVACCSSDWGLTEIIADSPTSPSLAQAKVTLIRAGTGPAGHLPTEVAMPVLRYTAFKGQCGRGRMSTPAVPTGWITASILTNVAAHNALATQMLADIIGATKSFHAGLYSRNGSRTHAGAGYALLGFCSLGNQLLGTVRRRKIGRGK